MSTATLELPTTKTIKVPKELFREATIKAEGEGADQRFRMSISSDEPYLRYDWWNDEEYWEVLSHAPGDIDEAWLKAGLPILFNHARDQHLARATKYSNNGHRVEVTDFIWSESDFAKSKRADAVNGSLPDTSVGYTVDDEGECIGAKDGKPIYKFKWTPFEGSIVTVPADIKVGVGRNRDNKPDGEPKEISIAGTKKGVDTTRNNENTRTTEKPPERTKAMPEPIETEKGLTEIEVAEREKGATNRERERVKKINDYVGALKNEDWKKAAAEIAVRAIESGDDFDTFRTNAINSFDGIKKVPVDVTPEIGMTPGDVKRFSFLGAIRQMATKGRLDGFEKETCEAAQKQMRRELKDSRSFVIPEEVTRHQNEQMLMTLFRSMFTRAQNVGSGPAGGFTVETQFGPLIELLRNRTVLGRLGITILDGLVGDFVMPVQTGGAVAYWVSETGAITDSEATFGQKAMVPHRLGASIPFTMQFIAQTSLSAEAFIRNEMDIVLALKKDLAGLLGTGLGGEPLGVANTPGINATVTYSGAAAWADVVEHETGIAVDNADIGSMGFVLDAATVGKWKTILKDSVAGAGYLIGDQMTANGYPVERSNQISAAHQSFFGVWSQLMLGMWAGREITVDNITLAKSGQHQIIMNELCDFLVRQPLAFNVSTDSAAQ
jgi:HK97 family phage major capsid protein